MVIKTNKFMPKWAQGIAIYPFILIRPEATEDVLIHEQVHIEQFKREPIIFWFKYLCSKNWKLKYECEAYAKQARWLKENKKITLASSKQLFTSYLLQDYNLNFSYEKVNLALTQAMKEK